jgi:TRAP-type C4-dicarboxylate transport system permease small subunit
MAGPFGVLRFISKFLNYVSAFALTGMMVLTVADVSFRAGGHPVVGTYEIAALLLAIVIGFGLPQVSLEKGHVYMEFLLEKLPRRARNVMNTVTRVMCLVLFAIIGFYLFKVGAGYHATGEVSPTVQLPFYPVAYAVGVVCLVECCVFLFDIVRIWRGGYE